MTVITMLSQVGISQVMGLSNVSAGLVDHTSGGSNTHSEQICNQDYAYYENR